MLVVCARKLRFTRIYHKPTARLTTSGDGSAKIIWSRETAYEMHRLMFCANTIIIIYYYCYYYYIVRRNIVVYERYHRCIRGPAGNVKLSANATLRNPAHDPAVDKGPGIPLVLRVRIDVFVWPLRRAVCADRNNKILCTFETPFVSHSICCFFFLIKY